MPDPSIESSEKKNSQVRSQIFAFLLFLAIILGLRIYFDDSKEPFSVQFQRLKNEFLSRLSTKDGFDAQKYVTQEVVEEESSVIDVVDKVSPSVVSIIVKTMVFDPFSGPLESEEGIGTGFIVDSNGLIVTNSHVVDVEGDYVVILKDGTKYDVDVVNLDRVSDLAILEISARDLPAVQLGDSSSVKVGQRAIAIGNALGRFSNTVTVGVVSGIARELTAVGGFGQSQTYEGVIQTDAALNPGNSGGPLLNSSGQVIGINVATTRGADNIGFAIPANVLKPILTAFVENGRIIRPFVGVEYSIITEDLSKLRDFPQGAFVSRVVTNSPAAKVGIKRGDIIVRVDGKEISSENSLSKIISEKSVGDIVKVEIDREGQQLELDVLLEEAPTN